MARDDSPYLVVLTTLGSEKDAHAFVRALVDRRLVACGTIVPGARSIYRWQGKIEQASEVVLIAKTRQDLVESLITRVKAMHSYECPCVIALPIEAGNPDYLAWIESAHKPDKR